jgi:hypothetical protein
VDKVDMSGLTKKLKELQKIKREVMTPAFRYFKNITPVDKGYARSHTTLDSAKMIIKADYDYASVLDAGRGVRDGQMRGSEQAPEGMVKPTIKEIKRLVKNYISKGSKK